MRSRPDFIHQRRDENLANGGGNVADIVLNWNEWPADSTVDPVTQARSGTPAPRSQTVRGLVHYVQVANTTQVRQFAEIAVGDCIVDLAPDVAVDGLADLRFVIADQEWVQKQTGGRLPGSWDALVGGAKLFRTILLRLST